MKNKIFVIPHTHWDREWYFAKDDIDILMEDNLQVIVNFGTKTRLKNFLLDGQTSLLEEFRDGCPVLWNNIKELLTNQTLLTGPWFSQPDFFSTLAESTIRNLEIGKEFMDRYGLSTKTIYSPDSFGFPENLPSIFNHLGFKEFVFWRGGSYDELQKTVIQNWTSPGGESVKSFCYYYGYFMLGAYFPYSELKEELATKRDNLENVEILDEWVDRFILEAKNMIDNISEKTADVEHKMLVPLGGDQAPITSLIPNFIEKVNERDPNNEWIVSNFTTYFKEIKDAKLSSFSGELKTPYRGRIHKTITSHRYDIKRENRYIEILLYNVLEPLAVIYKQIFTKFELKGNFERAVRFLLLSQGHDSMGSCCTDSTNEDILLRLKRSKAIIGSYVELMKKKIAEASRAKGNDLFLYNFLPTKRNVIARVNVFSRLENFKIFADQKEIDYLILKKVAIKEGFDYEYYDNYNEYDGFKTRILLKYPFDSLGYKKLKIIEHKSKERKYLGEKAKHIENSHYKVWDDGEQLYIKFKKEQRTISLKLSCVFNEGDAYDFSPSKKYSKEIVRRLHLHQAEYRTANEYGYVKFDWDASYYREPDLVTTNFQTYFVRVKVVDDQIFFDMDTYNASKNSKWTLDVTHWIPNPKNSYASQHLVYSKRKVNDPQTKTWKQHKYTEYPVEINTNDGIIFLKDKALGKALTVFTFGNNEYEICKKTGKIKLTLFRTCEVLGKSNLLWRPGRASASEAKYNHTPDAQLNKKLKFRIGFGLCKEKDLTRRYQGIAVQGKYYQKQNIYDMYNRLDRFFTSSTTYIDPKYSSGMKLFSFSKNTFGISAVKPIDKDSCLVRVYNPTNTAVTNVEVNNGFIMQENGQHLRCFSLDKYQFKTLTIKRASDNLEEEEIISTSTFII